MRRIRPTRETLRLGKLRVKGSAGGLPVEHG